MAKEIKYDMDARDLLKKGVDEFNKCCGVTYQKGRVIIEKKFELLPSRKMNCNGLTRVGQRRSRLHGCSIDSEWLREPR